MRKLAVLVRHLPRQSAVIATYGDERALWSRGEFLLTDVFHALTGKPHPARPRPPAKTADQAEVTRRRRLIHQRQQRRAAELAALHQQQPAQQQDDQQQPDTPAA